jgi:UDP-glucuronate 4-epimerase
MRFLITGTAGFIGFHLARRLLADGHTVFGVDGITPYYDQTLKRKRHELLAALPRFTAWEFMLEDAARLAEASADIPVHLAGQPGVRYSIEHPRAYIGSNIIGTFNLLEALRHHPCQHLPLASTSSVYGAHSHEPFEEGDDTDRPVSLYAATKKATEAIAYSYADLYGCRPPSCACSRSTVRGAARHGAVQVHAQHP